MRGIQRINGIDIEPFRHTHARTLARREREREKEKRYRRGDGRPFMKAKESGRVKLHRTITKFL